MKKTTGTDSLAVSDKDLLLHTLLKKVSRSFYLTLRVLPSELRQAISIAYLLARAADSITDTDLLALNKRLAYLQQLRQGLRETATTNDISDLCRNLNNDLGPTPGSGNIHEFKLLQYLNKVFVLYRALPSQDRIHVETVVKTLISGMAFDLKHFNSASHIKSLKDEKELDRYIYLVAGCVGDFWTRICKSHYQGLQHQDLDDTLEKGINYGKALQLTNILRDLPQDLRIGRCYLPQNQLEARQLDPGLLLDPKNEHKVRPLLYQWLKITLTYYDDAQNYCLHIPKRYLRLRLASLWPVAIGMATLNKMLQQRNYLDPDNPCKINRLWVYAMLLYSPLLALSNTLLKRWLYRLHSAVKSQLELQK